MEDWQEWIKNKKIAFFVAETIPSFAGGGRNAFYFARFLTSHGANTKIICLNYNNTLPKRQIVDEVQILRITYYNRFILGKIFSLFFLINAYLKQAKANDILIIYGRYLPAYISIILAGNSYHKRVIFRSTLLFDDDISTIKKRSGLLWPIYKFAFNKISLYFAINKIFEEKWREIFYDVVPVLQSVQGVDAGVFNKSNSRLSISIKKNELFSILSCGVLIERKEYKQAFQALAQLDFPFKYIVIGQHLPDKYHRISANEATEMESLYSLGKELLGDKIEFINSVENLIDYYTNADLFLHLAKVEGTPNVLLEAMAMGLPILTRQIDGLSSIIREGENTMIFYSETELYNSIKKLYDDREYANYIGENAANTIENGFTFNHVAAKIVKELKFD